MRAPSEPDGAPFLGQGARRDYNPRERRISPPGRKENRDAPADRWKGGGGVNPWAVQRVWKDEAVSGVR